MEEKKEYFENISRILDRALKVNNKTEEDLKENIMIVKKWVKTQPHLPEMPDDHTITSFLIMNKFSVENVKQKIDMYYTMRSLYPDYFENKHPLSPCMQHTMDKTCYVPMPKATDEEYRVIISHIFDENPEFDIITFFSLIFNVTEVRIKEDYNVGDIVIHDFKNVNLGHLAQCTPTHIKNYTTILEITLHKSTDTIKDYISKDILPKDYGGTGPSLREYSEIWKQKFTEYKGRFDTLDTLRVNEKLRPSPLINDEVLGYYGHFKKVDID
ncbi:retinol-binding protein pinta isoform X2 [Leptinotarsa decemlineata]|uniref:retinol-binding protein pinta isoform X2 n=1 Tax=Leptinotarsa decemlineata TaxID=7539 RepID=UPI003D3059CF